MRVITGEYRGRKLETPENYDVRPTSDKVKEAMFNILMNDIYDSVCCDLFSGTGSLGIEALSRGARFVYFGDSSRESLRLTKMNIGKCGESAVEKSRVIPGDYRKVLSRLKDKIDIFFLDPPYRAGLYENCLSAIGSLDLLSPGGIILAEHGSKDPLPERAEGLVKTRVKKYGKTSVSIYRREDESPAGEEGENE